MKFPNENLAKLIDGAKERIVADISQIFPGHWCGLNEDVTNSISTSI